MTNKDNLRLIYSNQSELTPFRQLGSTLQFQFEQASVLFIENEARKTSNCPRYEHRIDDTIVLEALYLRHNLSAVLRTAEAGAKMSIGFKGRPVEHGVARGAENG